MKGKVKKTDGGKLFIEYVEPGCHKQKGCDCWDAEKPKCSHFRDMVKQVEIKKSDSQTAVVDDEVEFEIVTEKNRVAKLFPTKL